MKFMLGLCVGVLCAMPCFALPDSPIAKVPVVHGFYDKQARITLYAAAAVGGFDMGQTCHNLAVGGHEDFMPAQQCYQVVLLGIGAFFAVEGISYVFHKTGHHKLERIPRFVMIGGNVVGLSYSKHNHTF